MHIFIYKHAIILKASHFKNSHLITPHLTNVYVCV